MTQDYYRILGVLDEAEDIVIKAAYKALAQRYHPDKWAGDSAEATRRMADINEAYGVLSDPVKRKVYDAQREKAAFEAEPESDDLNSSVEADWNKVIEYSPDLVEIAAGLAKISPSLVYSYKVILIDTKRFNERDALAERLESHYFEKYFGSNLNIRVFAKHLIISNKRSAAKELNEAVTLLGPDFDSKIIIDRISLKFQLGYDHTLIAAIAKTMDALLRPKGDVYEVGGAWFILASLGYAPRDKRWLFSTTYTIEEGGVTRELSPSDFNAFAIKVGRKYLSQV
jgi:curved DNA-binding protein CbpA